MRSGTSGRCRSERQRRPTETGSTSATGSGILGSVGINRFRVEQRLGVSNKPRPVQKAVLYPTRVLKEAGIPDVERDPFRVQIFPQDIYDLNPANFGAIDQSLSDPGVAWGASKAMTHIRRHRQ